MVRRRLSEQLRQRVDARGVSGLAPHRATGAGQGGRLELLRASGVILPQRELTRMVNDVSDEVVGFGPIEYLLKEPANRRVRLDPLDPSTFRHAGGCEHRDTTDPALLRAILKVRDGAAEGYSWVQCSACDTAWQVPHYAESAG